jgi:hypothetical protein
MEENGDALQKRWGYSTVWKGSSRSESRRPFPQP